MQESRIESLVSINYSVFNLIGNSFDLVFACHKPVPRKPDVLN